MASAPVTTGNTPVYRPLFKRVAQNDLKAVESADFLGEFACIATICEVPLEEVRNLAIKQFKHPAHGPFWITEELIQQLFDAFGWVASPWKKVMTPLSGLTDVAILAIDYDEDLEFGRPVVYQRAASKDNPKGYVEYIIDVAHWVKPPEQVTTDVLGYAPAWYISVHPKPYPNSGVSKTPPTPAAKK